MWLSPWQRLQRTRKPAAIMLTAVALSACTFTDSTANSNALSAQPDSVANANGLECVKIRRTGTRIPEKVCTTQAQRDAAAATGRDVLDTIIQGGGIQTGQAPHGGG